MKSRNFLIPILGLFLIGPTLFAGCSQPQAATIETITVPDTAGLTFEEAQAKLCDAGFEVERREQDSQTAAGTVIATDPGDGQELENGETITLLISRGPQMISLPALAGLAEAKAVEALSSLGLQCEAQRNYNEKVAGGLVYAMDPVEQSMVPAGSKVIVRVSLGSAYITCSTCGGSGTIISTRTCPTCGGSGVCYT